ATDPELFAAMVADADPDFDVAVANGLADYVDDPPEVLLSRWRAERDTAVKAVGAVPVGRLLPWLGRSIPAEALAGAGMMGLFGHGQDVAHALSVTRVRTDRLWWVAWFATLTWDFGYLARGLTAPDVEFRYELTAPSGAL